MSHSAPEPDLPDDGLANPGSDEGTPPTSGARSADRPLAATAGPLRRAWHDYFGHIFLRRKTRSEGSPWPAHLCYGFIVLCLVTYWVAGAAMIWMAERSHYQSRIDTFADALYWSVITLSTTGYGDLVPTSTGGRIVAGLFVAFGWLLLAGAAAVLLKDLVPLVAGGHHHGDNPKAHRPNE